KSHLFSYFTTPSIFKFTLVTPDDSEIFENNLLKSVEEYFLFLRLYSAKIIRFLVEPEPNTNMQSPFFKIDSKSGLSFLAIDSKLFSKSSILSNLSVLKLYSYKNELESEIKKSESFSNTNPEVAPIPKI